MMQRIIYIVLIWCAAVAAHGQAPSGIVLKLHGFRQENKVLLRWMLGDAVQWRYANEKGYVIERAEAGSNQYVPLTAQPVKAIPRERLTAFDSASPVFVATSFVLNPPQVDSMRGRKDEQMYSFYFLTASYETEAAVRSASGFVDSTIQAGKAYTYRITVAGAAPVQDTGFWSAPAATQALPVAPPLQAVFSNHKATLHWTLKPVAEQYFATVVERSRKDSLHFERFSIPMIKVRTHVQKTDDDFAMTTTDDIENGDVFYYRIKGLTLFGITGQSSSAISGVAGPDLTAAPVITGLNEGAHQQGWLQWTLIDSLKPVVAAYEIWQSSRSDSGYTKVAEVKAGIPFLQQAQVKTQNINYFIVKAIGVRQGQVTVSQPYMYQPVDSIPPAAPVAVSGKVDSNGVVTLTWKPNTEADLLGYRILKELSAKDEFVVLNATPGSSVTFRDTLPLKQLNKSMFYKVAAVDQRYNESALSAPVEVKRPDKIPPAPARLQSVNYSNGRLVITWKPSFSQDVVSYKLFRKASDDTSHAWKSLAIVKNTDTIYADKDVKEKVQYSYAIQAVDDADLVSKISPAFVGSVPLSEELKKGVRNLNTYVSRQYKYIELNWQSSDDAASEYWLYKAAGAGKLSLIATLPVATKKYVDEDLRASTHYRYAIKVVYKNGTGSQLEKIEVAY